MSDLRCTPEVVAEAMARFDAMPPEAKAEMWRKQRESWVRAFGPCEHGDYDWETCPQCLSTYRKA
jgi:hypothetical protein